MHTHPPAPRHEDSNPPKYSRMKANIVMSRIAGFREKKEKKQKKKKYTLTHNKSLGPFWEIWFKIWTIINKTDKTNLIVGVARIFAIFAYSEVVLSWL